MQRVRLVRLKRADADRFAAEWARVQKAFIDDPIGATVQADALILEVMRAQGYPEASFEQRVEDLSVHHGSVVEHYRAAQALASRIKDGQATTEELRQALIHFRAIFRDLLPNGLEAPHHVLEETGT
jgi:hypothetical protein